MTASHTRMGPKVLSRMVSLGSERMPPALLTSPYRVSSSPSLALIVSTAAPTLLLPGKENLINSV